MDHLNDNIQLAHDTINLVPRKEIPIGMIHIMEHSIIEKLARAEKGSYINHPYKIYIDMLKHIGVCLIDQMLIENPLTMGSAGYDADSDTALSAGVKVVDDWVIDSPEACAEHIEKKLIPQINQNINAFHHERTVQSIINQESSSQQLLGDSILKAGHGQLMMPYLEYPRYGYEPFFMAYALYPELIDLLFERQSEWAELHNQAVVDAYIRSKRPLYHRLDHDIADSRGLLVSLESLERSWLPGLAKAIKPAVDADMKLLWHCDGNLMAIVPSLIECGVNGFQGFQYEDGMDYVKICKMKSKKGDPLVIQAGVSVTRELPLGTPADVKRQIDFLVENGPEAGLFLAFSSSCAPGTPWQNIKTAVEGMQYYKKHGREKR